MPNAVNKYPAVIFTAVAFAFSLALVAVLCWTGNPANSLHTSALAWAFTVILAILAAYGVSAVVDLWKPKT